MGNVGNYCNCKQKDEEAAEMKHEPQNYGRKPIYKTGKQTAKSPNFVTVIDRIDLIVKLQALYRGHRERKNLAGLIDQLHFKKPKSGHQKRNSSIMTEDWDESGPTEYVSHHLFQNGAAYTGEMKNKMRHGKGDQVWPDGAKYEGSWRMDKAHGKGMFKHADGDIYDGQWEYDKTNGFGVYIHAAGGRYEGMWKDDEQHGKGKEMWPDGSKYDGYYNMGMKHGKGKYHWKDGAIYDGEWERNKIHGMGTYTFPDKRQYVGQWKENMMHGYGVYTYPDNKRYEGFFVNDKKQGKGKYFWNDGRIYDGDWLNNKQHGTGKYTANGKTKMGIWEQGRRTKWLSSEDSRMDSRIEIGGTLGAGDNHTHNIAAKARSNYAK